MSRPEMFNYRSTVSMFHLSERVLALPDDHFNLMFPAVLEIPLMHRPITWRVLHWWICKRHKADRLKAWAIFNQYSGGEAARQLKAGLAKHIAGGHDIYDSTSAGGLCRQEVTSLLKLIASVEQHMERRDRDMASYHKG